MSNPTDEPTHDIYIVIVGTHNEIVEHLTKIRDKIKEMTPGEMAGKIVFENNEKLKIIN